MKIGIIGAGRLGTALARRLAVAGHDVVISFARSPSRVADAALKAGGSTRAGTPDEAVAFGDVVVVATPWPVTLAAVGGLAAPLDGKVVWDTTNPLKADLSGLEIGLTTSAGEEMAKALPGARVVKAVPPFAELLMSDSILVDRAKPGAFVCGDDERSRAIVAGLLTDIGVDPVDAGPLRLARCTEPLGLLLVHLAYAGGLGARIGATLLRERA